MSRNHTKLRGLLAILLLSGGVSFGGDAEIKDAFDAGINSALLVLKHEKKQMGSPVPKGFCVSISSEKNGGIDPFNAIKMESLALHMGVPSPMYLREKQEDGQVHDILCFSLVQGPKGKAQALLRKIRKEYPRIDDFSPSIMLIENPGIYKHAVPEIGELHPDSSQTILQLTSEIETLKGKLRKTEKRLRGEIERKERAMKIIAGTLGGDIGSNAKTTGKAVEKKKKNLRSKNEKGKKDVAKAVKAKKAVTKKDKSLAKTAAKRGKARTKTSDSGKGGMADSRRKGYKVVPVKMRNGSHRVLIKIPE